MGGMFPVRTATARKVLNISDGASPRRGESCLPDRDRGSPGAPAGAGAAAPSVDVPVRPPRFAWMPRAASSRMPASPSAAPRVSSRSTSRAGPRRRPPAGPGRAAARHDAGRRTRDRGPAAASGEAAAVADTAPVRLVLRFRVPDATPAGIYEGPPGVLPRRPTLRARRRAAAGVRRPVARSQRSDRVPRALPHPAADVCRCGRGARRTRAGGRGSRHHGPPRSVPLGLPHQPGRLGVRHALARRIRRPHRLASRRRLAHDVRGLPIRSGRCDYRSARSARPPRARGSRRTPRMPGPSISRSRCSPSGAPTGWLDRALVWGWHEAGSSPVAGTSRRRRARPHAAGVRLSHDRCSSRGAFRRGTLPIPWRGSTRSFTIPAHGEDNGFLWDGQGCDDVDIWAVLSRRFYGTFATPVESAADIDAAARAGTGDPDGARTRGVDLELHLRGGARVARGTTGHGAGHECARLRPLERPRRHRRHPLRADGLAELRRAVIRTRASRSRASTSSCTRRSTSAYEPVTSRRLENLRDGIEDADLARMVVARHGRKALLAILARERDLLHPRRAPAARVHPGLRPPHGDEVRVAPLPPGTRAPRAALDRVHTALLEALAPASRVTDRLSG